jgi:hypothetical protein
VQPLHWYVAWFSDYANAEGLARHLRLRTPGIFHVDVVERQQARQPFGVIYAAEHAAAARHDVPATLRAVQ